MLRTSSGQTDSTCAGRESPGLTQLLWERPGALSHYKSGISHGRVWAAPAELASPWQPEVAELPLGSELPAPGFLTLGPQEANSPLGHALQSSSTEAQGGDTINILEVTVPV